MCLAQDVCGGLGTAASSLHSTGPRCWGGLALSAAWSVSGLCRQEGMVCREQLLSIAKDRYVNV